MRCATCQRENPPGLDRCAGCGADLPELGGDLEAQVLSLLSQGQKIGAVKLYREGTGVGLKEAKEAVEDLAARRGIVPPGGSGCLGVILIVAAVLGFSCWSS